MNGSAGEVLGPQFASLNVSESGPPLATLRCSVVEEVAKATPSAHVPRNGGVPVKRACRTAAAQSLRNTYRVAVGLSQAWLTTTCAVAEAAQPPFVVTVTLMSTAFVPLGVIVTVSPSAVAGVAFAI